jgi:glycosyltransferase
MKISIITICFNNEKDIRPTIESVINQTYKNIEYIIVDGASKDTTLEIVYEYRDKISRIISEPDKGLYDAINKGIKAATGDIVGLIHAGDCLYDDNVINKIAKHFEDNDIDISYGHSKTINPQGKCVRINKTPEFNRISIKYGWMPSHQSIYVKRNLFSIYGYYNLALHPFSDYEFFIRYFYCNNLIIKRVDIFIIKFSIGGISTNNKIKSIKFSKLLRKSWRYNGLKPPYFLITMKFLRKFRMKFYSILYNTGIQKFQG